MSELPSRSLNGLNPTEAVVLNTPPRTILRIQFPSNWDAADLLVEEFLGSAWGPLKEADGTPVRILGVAGDIVKLTGCEFQHARSVRFKSSASQGGVRTLAIQVVRLSECINGTGA